VKSRAILAFPAREPAASGAAVLTVDRPRPVGAPTRRTPDRARIAGLVSEAATTGAESLGVLEQRARQVAREFRWNRVADGRAGLMHLLDGAQSLLHLAVSAIEAAGDDLDADAEADAIRIMGDARRATLELVADQITGDWHALADTIERTFLPALNGWRTVFQTLAGGPAGPFDSGPFGHAA
jgi:hypothetical protein